MNAVMNKILAAALAAAVSFAPTANAELNPHIPQPPIGDPETGRACRPRASAVTARAGRGF